MKMVSASYVSKVLVCAALVTAVSSMALGQAVSIITTESQKKDADVVVLPTGEEEAPVPERASNPDPAKSQLIVSLDELSYTTRLSQTDSDLVVRSAQQPGEALPLGVWQRGGQAPVLKARVFFWLGCGFGSDLSDANTIQFSVQYNIENAPLLLDGGSERPDPSLSTTTKYYTGTTLAPPCTANPSSVPVVGLPAGVNVTAVPNNIGGNFLDYTLSGAVSSLQTNRLYFIGEFRLRFGDWDVTARILDPNWDADFCDGGELSTEDQVAPDAGANFYQPSRTDPQNPRAYPRPDRLNDTWRITLTWPPTIDRTPKLECAQVGFYRTEIAGSASLPFSQMPHAADILPEVMYTAQGSADAECVFGVQFPPVIPYIEVAPGRFAIASNVEINITDENNPKLEIGPTNAEGPVRYVFAFLSQCDSPPSFDFNLVDHDYGWGYVGLTARPTFENGYMAGWTTPENKFHAFIRPELQIDPEARSMIVRFSGGTLRAWFFEEANPEFGEDGPITAPIRDSLAISSGNAVNLTSTLSSLDVTRLGAVAFEVLEENTLVLIDSVRFQ